MPRNGRSARAGARACVRLLLRQGHGILSSLAAAAGGGVTAGTRCGNCQFGRAPKKRQLRRDRQGPKTGSRYARLSDAARQYSIKTSGACALQHRQAARLRIRAETPCRALRFRLRQHEIAGGGIVGGVRRDSRPSESRTAESSRVRKASATCRGVAPCASAIACSTAPPLLLALRKIVVAERRVGDHRDAMLLAPRDHRVLDRALLQMIEHLIAGDLALAGDGEHFVEIVGVEIADAPAIGFCRRCTSSSNAATVSASGYEPRQCNR